MSATALHDLIKDVKDEKSFLVFVDALHADQRSSAWENQTIDEYLDAAVAWAKDSNIGADQGIPKENVWQRVAAFLYCGKIYE